MANTGIRYHGHDGTVRIVEFESGIDAERMEEHIADEFETSTTQVTISEDN